MKQINQEKQSRHLLWPIAGKPPAEKYFHGTEQSMVEWKKRCWKTKILQAFGDDEDEGYGAENLFLKRLRIDDLDESYGDDRHNNYQQPAPAV